jgi:hypothetical protein
VTDSWYSYNVGNGHQSSGSTCKVVERSSATQAQLDFLAGLTLVPLDQLCTADGYAMTELQIVDLNGDVATFRDTGCPNLAVPDAGAMLPKGVSSSLSGAQACP